ncbi:MAG: cbb3-type cytochrome c oxidase subunit 3 [Pseudomonadales bacterium]|jgi:cytochrome c oxidase cbb3-type subunit 4
MDATDLRGITTLLVMITFLGVCYWAYSSKRKKRFDEAAQLPFADEDTNNKSDQEKSNHE